MHVMKHDKKIVSNKLKIVFFIQIAVFLVIASTILIPGFGQRLRTLLFIPWFVFFALGVGLIFLTRREKIHEKFRRFIIVTGASSSGFLVFVLLHNFFYALEIVTKRYYLISSFLGFLNAVFFVIAIFVCPLAFVTGVTGSIICFKKRE